MGIPYNNASKIRAQNQNSYTVITAMGNSPVTKETGTKTALRRANYEKLPRKLQKAKNVKAKQNPEAKKMPMTALAKSRQGH